MKTKIVHPAQPYVPALRFSFLTRLYDPIVRMLLRDKEFKSRLIQQAAIEAGHKVLDLGCGTGTLAIMIKKRHPGASVVGLDGDSDILGLAKLKMREERVELQLDHGLAFKLPYEDQSVDRVVSSLMFHHLNSENKIRAFREAYRVLRPGGEFHLADWDRPHNFLMRVTFWIVRLLDGISNTRDHENGKLPELMVSAGFREVERVKRCVTPFGTLSFFRAR